jgi:hypothetical protein
MNIHKLRARRAPSSSVPTIFEGVPQPRLETALGKHQHTETDSHDVSIRREQNTGPLEKRKKTRRDASTSEEAPSSLNSQFPTNSESSSGGEAASTTNRGKQPATVVASASEPSSGGGEAVFSAQSNYFPDLLSQSRGNEIDLMMAEGQEEEEEEL